MHLPTLRHREDQERRVDRELAETPRDIAIEWLTLKVAEGKLALDPFDPSLAVLDAGPNEKLWGYRSLELCGFVESRYDQPGGRQRIVACLESGVRKTLGLDRADAPVAADVPLASRGVDATHLLPRPKLVEPDTPTALMDAVFGQAPELQVLEATQEPVSLEAIRTAKDIYDRRVGMVCPACRGTGGGVYNDCSTCDGNGEVA